jgi:hypothetical protein
VTGATVHPLRVALTHPDGVVLDGVAMDKVVAVP